MICSGKNKIKFCMQKYQDKPWIERHQGEDITKILWSPLIGAFHRCRFPTTDSKLFFTTIHVSLLSAASSPPAYMTYSRVLLWIVEPEKLLSSRRKGEVRNGFNGGRSCFWYFHS